MWVELGESLPVEPKRYTMKLCIECKHHRKTSWEGMGGTVDVDECDYYKEISPVDGSISLPSCEQVRSFETMCGIKGVKWEPK